MSGDENRRDSCSLPTAALAVFLLPLALEEESSPTLTLRIWSTRSVYESPSSLVISSTEPAPRWRKAHCARLGLHLPSPTAVSVESTRNTALLPFLPAP